MSQFTVGLTGQTIGEIMDFASVIRTGRKYGVTHFEVWPLNLPGSGLGYRGREAGPVAELLAREGACVDCVTLEATFVQEAVQDRTLYIDMLKGAVDAACALGAKLVNHYCYFINLSETPDFDTLDRYWAEPLSYAKEKGVTLVLENEAHDATRHPETMAAIVEHFGDPAFRTNFDAVNYFHASEEGFPAAYEILRPYIGYVYLKNACLFREGAGQDERDRGAPMSGLHEGRPLQYAPVSDGSVNIGGLLTRIAEDGTYRGPFTLEPHTTPERVETYCARETAWLRDHGFMA